MTRNVTIGPLTPITGGSPNGTLGGAGTTITPDLERLNNFTQVGALKDGQVAGYNGTNWYNTNVDLSKASSNYDPTKPYNDGALVSFNNKVYRATERPDLIQAPPPVLQFKQFTQTQGQSLQDFLAANTPWSIWVNLTGADVTIPSGVFAGQVIPNGHSLYTMGFPPNTGDFFTGHMGVHWVKGWSIQSVAGSISFTQAEVDLIIAEQEKAKLVYAGASPTVDPAKWTLVGEPNDPNVVTKAYVDTQDQLNRAYTDTAKTAIETKLHTDYSTTTATHIWVNQKLLPLISGIEHGAAVLGIKNAPTGTEDDGTLYIIGTAPTGAFANHANHIAFKDGASWMFTSPQANEAHLNEEDNAVYHWNANTSTWNKINSNTVKALDNLTDVDTHTTAPVAGDMLQFNGTVWVPKKAPQSQSYHRLEHDFNTGITLPIPAGSVEIKGSGFWYVSTEARQSHPAFGFPTLPTNLTFENAHWHSQYFANSNQGTESAATSWINTHNVSGRNAKMGYIDGGTGWYVEGGGTVKFDFTITRYDATRIAVHWSHVFTRRDAGGNPGIFEFCGLIVNPFSSITSLALSVSGEDFKGVTSYTIT